jgi:hypothetical protein
VVLRMRRRFSWNLNLQNASIHKYLNRRFPLRNKFQALNTFGFQNPPASYIQVSNFSTSMDWKAKKNSIVVFSNLFNVAREHSRNHWTKWVGYSRFHWNYSRHLATVNFIFTWTERNFAGWQLRLWMWKRFMTEEISSLKAA